MKKKNNQLRPEYDLSVLGNGVRGKYAARFKKGTNLIHLDADVAGFFKSEESVNRALRSLIKLAKSHPAHSH